MKRNLEKRPGFYPRLTGQCSQRWWLAQPGSANTPNWDLVSTCRIEDRRGLILAEAKAHEAELIRRTECGATNPNFGQIENALAEATVAWNASASGFALSANSYYQTQ